MTTATQAAIDQNFADIQRVIESGSYEELNALLAEQRTLVSSLPFADPEKHAYITQAQQLTAWSLSIVQVHRSALANAVSDLNRKKLLQESYAITTLA